VAALASLPMYPMPEIADATDALWRAIATRLIADGREDVPLALGRDLDHHQSWRHPGLLFGQSCGYPLLTEFRDCLRAVAAPIYRAPGCIGRTHCSFFIVPRDAPARCLADLRGGRFAINSCDSNSGYNLPRLAFAPLAVAGRFFGEIVETGSHAASFARIANGEADCASIDCVAHALFAYHRPTLVGATRVIGRSVRSPTLPYVTAATTDDRTVAVLRQALAAVMIDPALAATRKALLLAGIVPVENLDYRVVLDYEAMARQQGYGRLA
jgi:ABC-type phosphate/phosphonate transport system substrate-binding protein